MPSAKTKVRQISRGADARGMVPRVENRSPVLRIHGTRSSLDILPWSIPHSGHKLISRNDLISALLGVVPSPLLCRI